MLGKESREKSKTAKEASATPHRQPCRALPSISSPLFGQAPQIWVRMAVLRAERTSHAWHSRLGKRNFRAFWGHVSPLLEDQMEHGKKPRVQVGNRRRMQPYCHGPFFLRPAAQPYRIWEWRLHTYTVYGRHDSSCIYVCSAVLRSRLSTHPRLRNPFNLSANASLSSSPGRRIIMVRVLSCY